MAPRVLIRRFRSKTANVFRGLHPCFSGIQDHFERCHGGVGSETRVRRASTTDSHQARGGALGAPPNYEMG